MDNPKHAIVVGAGVAGLAGAIRLAIQGFSVAVFEKNNYPGGKLGYFSLGDYHFDEGPSLFTQPALLEDLFALAGEPIQDYVTYQKESVCCHYFYEDGTRVKAFADTRLFDEELVLKNGESPGALSAYLQQSRKTYQEIGKIFLNHSLHKWNTLLKAPVLAALRATRPSLLFNSMDALNRQYFSSHKTVQLFNRYATYNGSNPYKAPAMLSLIPHIEHNEGVFYPQGGMVNIARALHKLAVKLGVEFNFSTPVTRIIHTNNRVAGVVVNGENKMADIVVSNMDVYFTYRRLLNQPRVAEKILKQERSSSALVFYWGIRHEFPSLGLHNIFFSGDYPAEFDHLFRQKKVYHDPTVYINITSKNEPGIQAPRGRENWFVMVNAPANKGQDWTAIRQATREAIIRKLNRILDTDITPFIEEEAIMDPLLIESKTESYMGSLYGTSSNSRLAAFLRHPNFSKRMQGLYFVGGSVHPGGGIPLCLQSAQIMSGLVQRDTPKRNH